MYVHTAMKESILVGLSEEERASHETVFKAKRMLNLNAVADINEVWIRVANVINWIIDIKNAYLPLNDMHESAAEDETNEVIDWEYVNKFLTTGLTQYAFSPVNPVKNIDEVYELFYASKAESHDAPYIVKTCSDCGESIVLTRNQVRWFKEKGFDIPKRCKECNQKRKEHFANKQQNNTNGNGDKRSGYNNKKQKK